MRTNRFFWLSPLVAAVALLGVGCDDGVADSSDRTGAALQTTANGEAELVAEGDFGGHVELERLLMGDAEQVYAGQPFQYTLRVTNTSDMMLQDVWVRETFQGNAQPAGAAAESEDDQGQQGSNGMPSMTHYIGVLDPGETREVQASAVAPAEGEARICAAVHYNPAECATIAVVAPELEFYRYIVDAEGELIDSGMAYACDELFLKYQVVNTGTGETGPIMITETLPEGISSETGNEISLQMEGLEGGESVDSDLIPLEFTTLGTFSNTATAQTERGLSATAGGDAGITIMRPELQLDVTGPSELYIGRTADYDVTVRNVSDYPAINTMVQLEMPEADRIGLSDGRIERDGDMFAIGELAAGESRSFTVSMDLVEPGEVALNAQAAAYCAQAVQQAVQTMVQGIPALQIEVVDGDDPIAVGDQTAYAINILNEGTAEDINIRLSGTLAGGLEFVSGEGDSDVSGSGQNVQFGTIQSLAPGDEANWQVVVRGTQDDRSRLTLELLSDAASRPVIEVETTNVAPARD